MPQLEQAVTRRGENWGTEHDAPRPVQNERFHQCCIAADVQTFEEEPQLRLVQPTGNSGREKVRLHRQFLYRSVQPPGPKIGSRPGAASEAERRYYSASTYSGG